MYWKIIAVIPMTDATVKMISWIRTKRVSISYRPPEGPPGRAEHRLAARRRLPAGGSPAPPVGVRSRGSVAAGALGASG